MIKLSRGMVAGVARKELEQRSGEKAVTSENYLDKSENQKRLKLINNLTLDSTISNATGSPKITFENGDVVITLG